MEDVKQFPVGSICIVTDSLHDKSLIGREVQIVEPLEIRNFESEGHHLAYLTDTINCNGYLFAPMHHQLKLKQEPPKESSSDEEAFRRFMDKTLMPLAVEQMEEA